MTLTDTHSHLYDSAFDDDRAQAVARAVDSGVERIMLPAIDSESHEALFALCREYPANCFPMMGLHPTSVNDNPDYMKELELVEKYLAEPPAGIERFYGVGEIGLDLYWSRDWIDRQTEVFERQIELALRHSLPIAVHTRSAWKEMTEVLERYEGNGLRGVMHAFSGSRAQYEKIRRAGEFVFGIGGVVTYKNSDVAEVVADMDMRDIVLETDCPYLTPVPFRGKRNESAYVKYVCAKVAEIKGVPVDDVASVTTTNARRIFGI